MVDFDLERGNQIHLQPWAGQSEGIFVVGDEDEDDIDPQHGDGICADDALAFVSSHDTASGYMQMPVALPSSSVTRNQQGHQHNTLQVGYEANNGDRTNVAHHQLVASDPGSGLPAWQGFFELPG
jgi:hypothetical protein